jgi:hypothetical protein
MNFNTNYGLYYFSESNFNYPIHLNYISNNSKITLNILGIKPIKYSNSNINYPSGKNYIILESEELQLGETKFFIRFNLEY